MNNLSSTLKNETDYPINFKKDQSYSAPDRHLNSISLISSYGESTIYLDNKKMYNEILDRSLIAKAGDTVTAKFSFTGQWMHGYVYIDCENNGSFDAKLNGKTIAEKSDLMTFSALHDGSTNTYYDCQGNTFKDGNKLQPPSFKIPDLQDGFYRIRYKVDWNCIDPAGNTIANNNIIKNRGAIVDTRLCIQSNNTAKITARASNGNLFLVQGSTVVPLNGSTTTIGKQLKIKIQPDNEFKLKNLKLRHGNLSENGNNNSLRSPQFAETIFSADSLPEVLEISSCYIDGDLDFTADFESSGYSLIFSDEFDQPDNSQPDPSKWRRSPRGNSTWNRFISDSNDVVFIKDKKLVLRCIPNQDKNSDKVDMLSGSIDSSTKFDFLYGKVECRLKTNPHKGNFPACWMMPTDKKDGWPKCGEIDIFEQIDTQNRAYHTVHSHWTYDMKQKTNPKSSSSENADMSQYHVYGLEWSPTKISWLLDGKEVFSYSKLSGNTNAINNGQWPFDKSFYLILNQSVGRGDWAQNPDLKHTYETIVDYIRLFLNISGHNPVALFGGYSIAAAIDSNGEIIIIANPLSPQFISLPGGEKSVQIACGNKYLYSLSASGHVYMSHRKSDSDEFEPFTEVNELKKVKIIQISGTFNHFFAISTDGVTYARGRNSAGCLGTGRGIEKAKQFTQVTSLLNCKIKSAYAGCDHSLFQTEEGKILACGDDCYGEIPLNEDPTEDDIFLPIDTNIKSGSSFSIAGEHLTISFVNCKVPPNIPNKIVTEDMPVAASICAELNKFIANNNNNIVSTTSSTNEKETTETSQSKCCILV